jgi:hypothetical protein
MPGNTSDRHSCRHTAVLCHHDVPVLAIGIGVVLLEFDREAELSPEVPVAFGVSAGEIPVRLSIAGVDLLGQRASASGDVDSVWTPLNLVEVATYGLLCVRQARRLSHAAFPLDETGEALLFVIEGEDMLVHSTVREQTVRVRFSLLEDAWQRFGQLVRDTLGNLFPNLKSHPDWTIPDQGFENAHLVDWEKLWQREVAGHYHCFDAVTAVEAPNEPTDHTRNGPGPA